MSYSAVHTRWKTVAALEVFSDWQSVFLVPDQTSRLDNIDNNATLVSQVYLNKWNK